MIGEIVKVLCIAAILAVPLSIVDYRISEKIVFEIANLLHYQSPRRTILDENGWNILVGANKKKILRVIAEFEPSGETYTYKFSDGNASKRIAKILGGISVTHQSGDKE